MIEFELSEVRTRPNMEERLQPPRTMADRGCGVRISAETSRKARTKGEGGDPVRCTGRQCRSCTGGAVADCVAICCCPCAVLNCLALAFIKIPFLIGKRWCLGFRRKRRKEKKGRKPDSAEGCDGDAATKEGNDGGSGGIDSWFEIGFEEGEIGGSTGEKLEGCGDDGGGGDSDKVWVELCEFDHLSFGRVSFAGIPLQT